MSPAWIEWLVGKTVCFSGPEGRGPDVKLADVGGSSELGIPRVTSSGFASTMPLSRVRTTS